MILTKTTTLIAIVLLAFMSSLMFGIASQKTTIVDESPHIVAGYSYLIKRDYRLNPEHPPLIKILSAIPLAFQDINFPDTSTAWTNDLNGQWTLGAQFLHEVGNSAESITFWARMAPMLLTLLLGFMLFSWTRSLYGSIAGLFALILFAFSPTFLAHGPLVTTDVGAALAFFAATFFLFRYLARQTKYNLLLAGIAFGLAQLAKFSLILILPYFTVVVILWVLFKDRTLTPFSFYTLKRVGLYLGRLILIGLVGLLVVYPVYQYTISNYPADRQLADAIATLENSPYQTLARGVVWMSDKPILKAYGQFFMGHLMVFQRVQGGNTVYFLGDVTNSAWWYYFPAVFLLKVPLALLLFMLIATLGVWGHIRRQIRINLQGLSGLGDKTKKLWRLGQGWMDAYFIEIALGIFIIFYWGVSMLGNLNIGVRHILPTLPFLYLILAGIISRWIHGSTSFRGLHPLQMISTLIYTVAKQWLKVAVVVVLLLWYVFSSLSVFPHSLAYFNEIAGGPDNGYTYVVDSNLDWGQDLQGLARYVEKNNIAHIKVDYFGGGSPAYYLSDRYEHLDARNPDQRNGWIAVSATLLQGGRGEATKGFDESTQHYAWLNDYTPVAKIGYSIFVYFIE